MNLFWPYLNNNLKLIKNLNIPEGQTNEGYNGKKIFLKTICKSLELSKFEMLNVHTLNKDPKQIEIVHRKTITA